MKSVKIALVCSLICLYASAHAQGWTPNKKYTKQKTSTSATPAKAFQCWGTTKKGDRCKRKVNADHSFCYQHQNQQ